MGVVKLGSYTCRQHRSNTQEYELEKIVAKTRSCLYCNVSEKTSRTYCKSCFVPYPKSPIDINYLSYFPYINRTFKARETFFDIMEVRKTTITNLLYWIYQKQDDNFILSKDMLETLKKMQYPHKHKNERISRSKNLDYVYFKLKYMELSIHLPQNGLTKSILFKEAGSQQHMLPTINHTSFKGGKNIAINGYKHTIYKWSGYVDPVTKTKHGFNKYSDKAIYLLMFYGLFHTFSQHGQFYFEDLDQLKTSEEKNNKIQYKLIKSIPSKIKKKTVVQNKNKRKRGRPRKISSSENEYEIDEIVDETDYKYRVRWAGYGVQDDTWEDKEYINKQAPEAVKKYLLLDNETKLIMSLSLDGL